MNTVSNLSPYEPGAAGVVLATSQDEVGDPGNSPLSLTFPIGAMMRNIEPLDAESSIERAATLMRGGSQSVLPVCRGKEMLGVVTEGSLAEAMANGVRPFEAVEVAVTKEFPTISVFESGAEALRRLASGDQALLVLDREARVVGIVTASDLYARQQRFPRPPMIGGMATPFGVYLTNGAIGAGVPGLALVSTGVVMFLLFALGAVAAMMLQTVTGKWDHSEIWANLWSVFPVIFLFVGMRLSPMAGIHAAEHKVVHAIERGEPLVPEVVSRMPRVHPRCGTNLFAGATIFVSIYEGMKADDSLRLLVAALATFILWRPVGSLLQWLLTTRPPNRKQIEMGIRSGKALLEKYRMDRRPSPNPFQRIWNSGMVHVMAGFVLCEGIAQAFGLLFHVQMPF